MSALPDHVVVQVTFGRRPEAEHFARLAVERRLAASGQVEAVRTWYRWKGHVQEAEEHRVSLYTRRERFKAVAELVREYHTYELPQVVGVPLSCGTEEFLRWIDQSCLDPAP